MSRNYDNWEKLVRAVLRKEKDRQLAYCESFSSSCSDDLSSCFSLDPHLQHEASGQNIFFSRGVMAIKYEEIRNATTNFGRDMVLAEEKFGTVYKGWIDEHYAGVKPGSGIAVAVKILNNTRNMRLEKWMDEITCSGHRHPNLVTLVGYSFEFEFGTYNPVLVYEHMPNGSLANQLFQRGGDPLPWATRIKVAVGVARGLAFLHALEIPVMHHNVRSFKIFLDEDFNAKLREFDAVLSYCEQLDLSPRVSKSHPSALQPNEYADPMYLATGFYSKESDVYSFGLVLLELLSSLPAFDPTKSSQRSI